MTNWQKKKKKTYAACIHDFEQISSMLIFKSILTKHKITYIPQQRSMSSRDNLITPKQKQGPRTTYSHDIFREGINYITAGR